MSEDGFQEARSSTPPRELEVRFWTLVMLAKVVILVLGLGVILLLVTPYRTAGAAISLIGVAVAVRWWFMYRRTTETVGTSESGQ